MVLGKPSPLAQDARVGIKNKKHPTKNNPVLTIGQAMADKIVASVFFSLNVLYINPLTSPAILPLIKTVKTVPKTLTAKNGAASPLSNTTMPNTRPNQKPAIGPYKAAPTTIGINTKDIENGPSLITEPINCKTITIAVSIPMPVINLILSFLIVQNIIQIDIFFKFL